MYNTSLKNKSDSEKTIDFTVEKNKLEEALNTARKLKSEGRTSAEIAKLTNLSTAEIDKL